jgi:hypothetical protein
MPKTHKKKGGGFFDTLRLALDQTKRDATNSFNSLTQTVGLSQPSYGSTQQAPAYGAPQQAPGAQVSNYAMGGKRRRRSRRMRGGNFTDNMSRSGLASTAAPISGIRSAQPHNLVGGRTRRRRSCNCSCKNKHSKSCRSRKR